MKKIFKFPLEDGSYTYIEVDDNQESGMVEAARPGEIYRTASKTFEQALESISPGVRAVLSGLKDLPAIQKPKEIEVEFGIKISGSTDAVFASMSGEANFTVKLKWSGDAV
jgi:Trypsin-co-occurring domain 1